MDSTDRLNPQYEAVILDGYFIHKADRQIIN